MSESYYKPLPELIPSDIIERYSKLSSAQLCDGMEGLGILRNGAMDATILPVDNRMRMIGTASTVETEEGDNFPIHVAIYQCKPGYILVVDGKAYTERAYMGDLMVSASKAIGLEGVVVDGYVRDREGLTEIGMPVFSRGFMQRSPSKKGPGKINCTVNCGGVLVQPGDLIFGDYDGVTVVPRESILEVLERAEKKGAYEKNRRKTIDTYAKCRENGEELPVIAPAWVSEMIEKVTKA